MSRPLEGIKIVEVAMWAFVPAAAGILSDMGASVIKVEPPTGDPLRGLSIGGVSSDAPFNVSWENYNRGKRSVTLDLRQQEGAEVLYRLVENADVFLTNLLPPARRKMKIDIEDLRAINPKLIYAVGSGIGRRGPDGDKGGYDSISFWSRGGIASSISGGGDGYPAGMPTGAFGDSLSAAVLAGGISAAIAQRAMTGHASIVDASLLNTSMWAMQRAITQATLENVKSLPKHSRAAGFNALTNTYRTSDNRFIMLCMLQGQRYWPGFCEAAGRPDLINDPRFATDKDRLKNVRECVAMLDTLFASKNFDEWREILGRQAGQWDIVQEVGELKDDPQVIANGYMQRVDYGNGRALDMVSVPIQFDEAPMTARPAPGVGEHSDEILESLGYDEEQIINLKIAGVVF